VTGEWPGEDPANGTEYDRVLAAAVKSFQRHHGLDPDGVVGRSTLEAMNVPVSRRIRQLVINMETWRWVAREHGDWWLAVNIPSFRLVGMRGDKAGLFRFPKRTFSHGCIRVSGARELAAYVLGGPEKGWTEDRVLGLIADGKNQIVHLDPSLPVYIL
jgi:murein L,D-transpeptidase YcbB/YkuD